jgi:hypothetical protein
MAPSFVTAWPPQKRTHATRQTEVCPPALASQSHLPWPSAFEPVLQCHRSLDFAVRAPLKPSLWRRFERSRIHLEISAKIPVETTHHATFATVKIPAPGTHRATLATLKIPVQRTASRDLDRVQNHRASGTHQALLTMAKITASDTSAGLPPPTLTAPPSAVRYPAIPPP